MATPLSLTDATSAKRAIARYWAAHDRAFPEKGSSDYMIPHQVLRDYLDVMWAARIKPGLHNKTITVTRTPILGILDWDVMLEEGVEIRVEGAKWA
jgi:hypothetical protein